MRPFALRFYEKVVVFFILCALVPLLSSAAPNGTAANTASQSATASDSPSATPSATATNQAVENSGSPASPASPSGPSLTVQTAPRVNTTTSGQDGTMPSSPNGISVLEQPQAVTLPTAANPAPHLVTPEGGLSLSPYLFALADPAGSLTAEQMLEAEKNAAFAPFHVLSQFQNAGVLWLRFTLSPTPNSNVPQSLAQLDLGKQIPDSPQVWIKAPGRELQGVSPGAEGFYSLQGLTGGGEVYIRLEGMPGLWFTPLLITPAEAYSLLEGKIMPLTLAALSVLLLLCFLRSMLENGDWRFWAGVFATAALVQAIWGIPSTPHGRVLSSDMPGILAAGIALMLLPHVGRHIMRTRTNAPFTDVLLLVLALPGAALALLPLLPGMAWTARLVTLWPLGAALCLLPALALRVCGVPGSGLFFLACLGMTAGTAVGLVGIGGALVTPLYGLGPLLGVTFATLLIAAAAPRDRVEESEDEDLQLATSRAGAGAVLASQPLHIKGQMPVPLRKNSATGTARSGAAFDQRADALSKQAGNAPQLVPLLHLQHLEEALRTSLDHVLQQACLVDQCLDLPGKKIDLHDVENARRHADALVAATRELASQVTDIPRTLRKAESRKPAPIKENALWPAFNLQRLIIQLIDEYREEAEAKGLALAWHIAPYVPFHYRGDSDRLRDVLALLLSDAIRATERGSLCLRVRRDEQSANPGHLLFHLVDTGLGTPPLQRNALALARVWELTAEHQGTLNIESSPQGMDLSFTLHLVALGTDNNELPVPPTENATVPAEPQFDRIIVASCVPLNRQLLSFYLEGQGQSIWEARDADEAVSLYQHTPTGLIVLDGHLPEDDIIAAVAHIRVLEGEFSLPTVPLLALTLNEEQAERLHQAGCDHSLPLPVGRSEFRAMAMYLTNPTQERRQAKRRYAAAHSFAIPKPAPENSPASAQPLKAVTESAKPVHMALKSEHAPDLVLPIAPTKGTDKDRSTASDKGKDGDKNKDKNKDKKPGTVDLAPSKNSSPELSTKSPDHAEGTDTAFGKNAPEKDRQSASRQGFDPSRVVPKKAAKQSWLSSLFSKPKPEPLHVENYSELDESVGTPVPVIREEPETVGAVQISIPVVSAPPVDPTEQRPPEPALNAEARNAGTGSAEAPNAEALNAEAMDAEARSKAVLHEAAQHEAAQHNVATNSFATNSFATNSFATNSAVTNSFATNSPAQPAIALNTVPQAVLQAVPSPVQEILVPQELFSANAQGAAPEQPFQQSSAVHPFHALHPAPSPQSPSQARTLPELEQEPVPLSGLMPSWAQEGPEVLSVNQLRTVSPRPVTFFAPRSAPATLSVPAPQQSSRGFAETNAGSMAAPAAYTGQGNINSSDTQRDDSNRSEANRSEAIRSEANRSEAGLLFVNPTPLLSPSMPISESMGQSIRPVLATRPPVASESSAFILEVPVKAEPALEIVREQRKEEDQHKAQDQVAGQDDQIEQKEFTPAAEPGFAMEKEQENSPITETAEVQAQEPEAENNAPPKFELASALEMKPVGLKIEPEPAPLGGRKPVPFLTLDPLNVDGGKNGSEQGEDIVDLTEDQLIEPLLVQQIPELIRSLDAAMEHARNAFANKDAWALSSAAARMADRAVAFGLHGLADLARCTEEAARHGDLEGAGQLLPEVQAEIERNRR